MAGKKTTDPLFTFTTGPVDIYPAVSRALSKPIFYDGDPAFLEFYETVNSKLQRVFHTKTPPVILQGEPVLALEAAAASLIGKEDVVLNLVSGVYGKGFGHWAARYGKKVLELSVPYHDVLSAEAVHDMLRRHPEVAIVSLCHHDTPSGTINPAGEIGAVVKAAGKLLIIDCVSSFGGMEILPQDCGADIFVTGPNKCLGCPPGLSLLHVSDEAWEKIAANAQAPTASVLSISAWREAYQASKPFPFTPSIAEINALDAALDLYLQEGETQVWARHDMTARACRTGIKAAGLELWPAREEIAAPTCTAVALPDGMDEAKLRREIRKRFGVVLSAGRGETLGKLIRIGHMGVTAQPTLSLVSVAALAGGMQAAGVPNINIGAGVEAVMSVIEAAQ